MHPVGLSRCLVQIIWMLFVSSFRLCIQMNHLNSTTFFCFLFYFLTCICITWTC
ncbi:unnamed protein product [Brassica oleracea var. botrytis]